MTRPLLTTDDAVRVWLQRRHAYGSGWRRWVFPGLWLIYLGQTVGGVHRHSSGAAVIVGDVIVVAFAVCYLACIPTGWSGNSRRFFVLYSATLALTGVETVFAHDDAFVFLVYVGVLTVAGLPRQAPYVIPLYVAVTFFAPVVVRAWGGTPDIGGAIAVALVPLAMYGFFGILRANVALTEARAEVARLAAENERTRIARDLHDLLGHSLTTVTVKAGLARRLAERGEIDRAVREVGEVETLARRTLGEVRAAVDGYRDVTLSGELASSREVLRAAGIEAVLPGAVDIVDDTASEPFGWVVREAVTNVVRHARATRCTITLGPRWVEVVDNGIGAVGAPSCAGNGLTGVAERILALGGRVHAQGAPGGGWRVRAELPEPQAAGA